MRAWVGGWAVTLDAPQPPRRPRPHGEAASEQYSSSQLEKIISSFCENLSIKAKRGKIDPVIGRANEIEETVLILARRQKANVMLVGDPGVGKTAIAEGLAVEIANDNACRE